MARITDKLGDGLPDDFDGTITSAYFGTDATYQSGEQVCLIVEIESPELEKPERKLYSVGKGWETQNKGTKVVHESGRDDKNFNKNTSIGRVITAIASDPDSIAAFDAHGGDVNVAASWEGLKCHWERKEFGAMNDKPIVVLVPTKVYGGAGKSNGTKAKTEDKGGAISGLLKAKLTKLAKDSGDADTFLMAAFELAEVDGDAGVQAELMDGSFYAAAIG